MLSRQALISIRPLLVLSQLKLSYVIWQKGRYQWLGPSKDMDWSTMWMVRSLQDSSKFSGLSDSSSPLRALALEQTCVIGNHLVQVLSDKIRLDPYVDRLLVHLWW